MAHNSNVLSPETIRVGTLVSDDYLFPEMQVPIRITEDGIEITISWNNVDAISNLWIDDAINIAEIAEIQDQDIYPVPRNLWFYDIDGSIALLNCRKYSMTQVIGGDGGARGTIIADCAVMGARLHTNYQKIYGLRTSIAGLRQWIGNSNIERKRPSNRDSRNRSETLIIRSPDDIRLQNNPLGYIHFDWSLSYSSKDDTCTINDKTYIETRSSHLLSWQSARHLSKAIQDLLRISYGEDRDLTESQVLRSPDTAATANEEIANEWLPITEGIQERHKPKYDRGLIQYAELKEDGVQKWLSLYDQIPRAIDPIVTSFTLDKATPEVRLLEAGSGLEALGYYLLKADGKNKKDANKFSFKDRLKRITENLKDILPFEVNNWILQTTSAYNGIKHANRKRPDKIVCLNSWQKAVLTFRCWIALNLGIDKDILKSRAELDHMRGGYKLLWGKNKDQE